jgi:hypothetical protein
MRPTFVSPASTPSPAPADAHATQCTLRLEAELADASASISSAAPREIAQPAAQHVPEEAAGGPLVVAVPERSFPPDFTWSHSKSQVLISCARRFGLHYVLSKGGGRAGAAPEVREAFKLKQLKSLAAEVGSAVHERAAECARAVIDGLPLPTLDELVLRTRGELNALALSSRNLAAFEARPFDVPMLREVYYDAEAKLRPYLVGRAREAMLNSLETLHREPLWKELRSIPNPRANILLPDKFNRFDFRGRHVYAAPDLVFRRPGLNGEPAPWSVVDWKVSRQSNGGDVTQVALYGVAVVAGFDWPLVDGCEGRVINLLLDEEDRCVLTGDDLADAVRRIIDGADGLWSMLMDEAGAPRTLTRGHFAMTTQPRLCGQCVFRAACDPDAAAALARRTAAA